MNRLSSQLLVFFISCLTWGSVASQPAKPTFKELARSYYQRVALKIEEAGTNQFPTQDGEHIYGSVTIEIWLNNNGRIEEVLAFDATSKSIEDHAKKLVRSLQPYERPPLEPGKPLVLIKTKFNYTRQE